MSDESLRQYLEELRQTINDHNYRYHVLDEPVISDAEYDKILAELRAIEDQRWAWHIGLDAESTVLLNDLWRGEEIEQGRFRRLLALFRLDFEEPAAVRADIAGRPVYLALSMDENGKVRMKPQNLLLNLPLAPRE